MFKYKLSIIVPCYNSSNTIGRLIDSVVNNDLTKDEYELIIVDDNSTDNFMNIVKRYEDKANIAYYKTNTNVHCPGNTRQVGLDNAKGEWITFIDHDDYFEPNIFRKVFDCIKAIKSNTVLCTSFHHIMCDGNIEDYKNETNYYYHHGKFYNHQMLIDGNINFEKDLVSFEDVYFNNLIECFVLCNDTYKHIDFASDMFTYNWVETPGSITHYKDNQSFFLVDLNFNDYIHASCDPVFKLPDKHYKYKYHTILPNFLKFYFQYQQGLHRFGDEYAKLNFKHMADLKHKICELLKIDNDEIIDYFYSKPDYYQQVKNDSFKNMNVSFVERQSLYDFVMSL